VTLHLLDVASYQGDLRPEDVRGAGFGAVNLKISHGLGLKSVHPMVAWWARQAEALGLGISTFHYMTAEGGGEAQAEHAHEQLSALGLLYGTVHQLDVECEPPPPLASVRGYLTRMTALLGRPVALYTGDWWWRPKGWNVADLAPYLWAAPNAGYLGTYPGDSSPHWAAGYSGWRELSVMQYGVSALPGGTIKVSKSAIRDMGVWRMMTGEAVAWTEIPASKSLFAEFNAVGPKRSKASDGRVGDLAHQESVSDHNPDETGNTGGVEDTDAINEVHAADVTAAGPWPAGWTMEKFVQLILARCRSGAEKRLRYIIFNKRIWSASSGWVQKTYSGANPHDKHAHFSFKYGSGSGAANPENDTSPWGLLAAVNAQEEDDMPTTKEVGDEVEKRMKAFFAATKQANGLPESRVGHDVSVQGVPDTINGGGTYLYRLIGDIGKQVVLANKATQAILANVLADDAEGPAVLARLDELQTAVAGLPDELLAALGDSQASDQEVAAALAALLGDRATAVGALLQRGGA